MSAEEVNKHLRREIRRLQDDKFILEKAAAWFASRKIEGESKRSRFIDLRRSIKPKKLHDVGGESSDSGHAGGV